MADISKEINDFKNAIYGEEVRGSMITLAEKVNTEVETNTTNVNAAVSTANTASGKANQTLETAQEAIDEAETTLQAANTAKADAQSSAEAAAASASAAEASKTSAAQSAAAAAASAAEAEQVAEGLGGFNGSAASVTAVDTQGMVVETGENTNAQALFNALALKVAQELVSNEELAQQLASYVAKTDIVQTESTATNKVPSSAYLKTVKDTINSNLTSKGIVDPQSAQANINTDWVSSGSVYYRITNGICFVDFDLTLKTITILKTLIVSGLPTAKIMAHSKLQGWEDNTISVPCYVFENNMLANPGPAGHYVGSFSYAVR